MMSKEKQIPKSNTNYGMIGKLQGRAQRTEEKFSRERERESSYRYIHMHIHIHDVWTCGQWLEKQD